MGTTTVWDSHEISIERVDHSGMFNVYCWAWDECVNDVRLSRKMFDNIADAVTCVASILRDRNMSAGDISDAVETIVDYGVTWDFLFEPEGEHESFGHYAYMVEDNED